MNLSTVCCHAQTLAKVFSQLDVQGFGGTVLSPRGA